MTTRAEDTPLARFESLLRKGGAEEAQSLCLRELAGASDDDERLAWIYALTILDREAGRLEQAEALHLKAKESGVFDRATAAAMKGKFANGLANTYKAFWERGGNEEHFDRAIIGYEEARFYFELAGQESFAGFVENNIGALFVAAHRPAKAKPHLERAREIFEDLGEPARVAEVEDTLATAYEAEGDLLKAQHYAASSVAVLSLTDEEATLERSEVTLDRIRKARIRDVGNEKVRRALMETGGSVREAAKLVGVSYQAIEDRLKRYPELCELVVRRGAK